MKFEINGTGEEKELTLTDQNGVDWAEEIIGNSGAIGDYIKPNSYSGLYEIDQDNFDWWVTYFDDYKVDSIAIDELKEAICEKYSDLELEEILEDFGNLISEAYSSNYEEHHANMLKVIAEVEENYL